MLDCDRRTGGALRPHVEPLRPETAKPIALGDEIQQVAVGSTGLIYIVPADTLRHSPSPETWIAISDGETWDDKPRWSPGARHECDPTAIRREFALPEVVHRIPDNIAAKAGCKVQKADICLRKHDVE